MNKVLVITYYWPPGGGAGVQRWLKFVKYLRSFNWEPVVYTPENPEHPVIDHSLLSDIPADLEVLKTKIFEPYAAYKLFSGRKKDDRISTSFLSENKKGGYAEDISVWIRGNFFIPDARKFWIRPSVKYLSGYLKENTVNAIVTTGPPHSMHLIGMKLQHRFKIPWLADFRDPWTNIDFYNELKLTKWADNKHHKLEKEVLSKANEVVVISNGMATDFKRVYNREYHIITNGYDEADKVPFNTTNLDKKFSITHIGSVVKSRNPEVFFKVIKNLCEEVAGFKDDVEINLVGKVDYSVQRSVEDANLLSLVNVIDYIPHSTVSQFQQKSQVLLLLINDTPNAKVILTGKLFEYMGASRPVLCLGPTDGCASQIIKSNNLGAVCGFNDENNIKTQIVNYYNLFKAGKLFVEADNTLQFTRKYLTGELAFLLNKMVSV